MPLHVVPDRPGHGVTRYAAEVAAAVGARVVTPQAALTLPATPVHVHLTDALFGSTPAEAAEAVVALAARHPTTVTLHDVPQPTDGDGFARRVAAYAEIVVAVRGWVVSSEHERAAVEDHLAPSTPGGVVHLPVIGAPRRTATPVNPVPVVGLLGWVYPGKGHREVVAACAALDRPVVVRALGGVSPGCDGLAAELAEAARAADVGWELTGYLSEADLTAAVARVDVPVAGHRNVSASGSLNSWVAAGRRPLVRDGRYTAELAALRPGTLTRYADADLAAAIAAALADPARTLLAPDAVTRPHLDDVAAAYLAWWTSLDSLPTSPGLDSDSPSGSPGGSRSGEGRAESKGSTTGGQAVRSASDERVETPAPDRLRTPPGLDSDSPSGSPGSTTGARDAPTLVEVRGAPAPSLETTGDTPSTVPGNRWDLLDGVPAPPTSVTVVVCHYDQPTQLARTLAALDAQTHPAHLLEVVVADDGSPVAPEVPGHVRLVRQEDRGFRAGAARNLGAAHATGDVLVFLDADTSPEPAFVEHLTRLPALLSEAVVVGRRRHAEFTTDPPTELAEPRWLSEAYAASRDLRDADELSFRHVISAVLACRRTWFDEVGGFDETFEAYGGEDWEWAHRAWTRGALLAREPRAVAWHDGPDRAERPGWGDDPVGRSRHLAETLAIAGRIPVAGVAPHGLALGPPDPVVTLDPALTGQELVLTLDSLLAAFPRAVVALDDVRRAPLAADPRLVAEPDITSAWRHLHLHTPLRGEVDAWRQPADLLRGAGAPGAVDLVDVVGARLATWTTYRSERRAARWRRLDLDGRTSVVTDLGVVAPRATAQAVWGGWG